MRFVVLAFASAWLAACSIVATDPPAPDPAQFPDRHCRSVATARASDANENGYDKDMQRKIFADTYRACITPRAAVEH